MGWDGMGVPRGQKEGMGWDGSYRVKARGDKSGGKPAPAEGAGLGTPSSSGGKEKNYIFISVLPTPLHCPHRFILLV